MKLKKVTACLDFYELFWKFKKSYVLELIYTATSAEYRQYQIMKKDFVLSKEEKEEV